MVHLTINCINNGYIESECQVMVPVCMCWQSQSDYMTIENTHSKNGDSGMSILSEHLHRKVVKSFLIIVRRVKVLMNMPQFIYSGFWLFYKISISC